LTVEAHREKMSNALGRPHFPVELQLPSVT
jgi:hypothetical protein